MDFIPAPGCVLIKPIENESAVATLDRNYNRIGEVLKKYGEGTGVEELKVGDLIFFDEYAYRRFDYQGKEYCVVDVSHDGLWGILKHATDSKGSDVPQEGVSA